jgi:uncharacterized protein YkwD
MTMKKSFLFAGMFLLFLGLTLNSCSKDDEDKDPVLSGLEAAKADYTTNYLGTAAIPIQWTGTTAGCNEGSISTQAQANVIQRVNYYRRLVGLPDNITLNSSQNQACQQAALYMLANKTLTHYPASNKLCYTAAADDAAGRSNIAMSSGAPEATANHTVNAVSGYIEDPGANNLAVGHRAWILLPQLTAMGSGSVTSPSENNFTADCLMWGDNYNSNLPKGPEFVAYPPANYIPSSLVFPRWSFSIQGADFNNATVSMTNAAGASITCNVIHRSGTTGYPDARIAWEPQGVYNDAIAADTDYNVTISNITGADQASYTYTVKVFKVTSTAKRTIPVDEFREILSL